MIRSLWGSGTNIHMLKGGLEEQAATQRAIARRVAAASEASTSSFGTVLEAAATGRTPAKPEIDLQVEMASLAETQLRYEASAKLLSGAYDKLRLAIRDRG